MSSNQNRLIIMQFRCKLRYSSVASFGYTERQARDVFKQVKVGKVQFSGNGKAWEAEGQWWVKLVSMVSATSLSELISLGPSFGIASGTDIGKTLKRRWKIFR